MIKNDDLLKLEKLASVIQLIVKNDGITLNFSGYRDFLTQYWYTLDADIQSIHDVNKEALMWSNYFSEVRNILLLKLNNMDIDYSVILANPYRNNKEAIKIKEQRIYLRLFIRQLNIQKYICVNIFFKNIKVYKNSSNNLNFSPK